MLAIGCLIFVTLSAGNVDQPAGKNCQCTLWQADEIVVRRSDKDVHVQIGNKTFTRYDFSSFKKPIFYPVFGPRQLSMTRNYPMNKSAGEADDHPHHKSMWIGHQINGVDFWSEKGGSVKLRRLRVENDRSSFTAQHDWIDDRTGDVVVSDEILVGFEAGDRLRLIDFRIKFTATTNVVEFADTKEGFFAMRLHPQLRLTADPTRGVATVSGQAVNDRGITGKNVWGRKARWVDYSGQINGQICGVAIFDHPDNLRHPTTWHARDYGLFAANPFGLHHFQGARKGSGRFQLKQGDSVTFNYRVVLHLGDADDADIGRLYENYIRE